MFQDRSRTVPGPFRYKGKTCGYRVDDVQYRIYMAAHSGTLMVQGDSPNRWFTATVDQSNAYFLEWVGRRDSTLAALSAKSPSFRDSKTQQWFHYALINGIEYYVNDHTLKKRMVAALGAHPGATVSTPRARPG